MSSSMGVVHSREEVTALLISNDPGVSRQIVQSMQQLAVTVESCRVIPEALNLLGRRKFDAIVLDLNLGDEAHTLLQQIRLSPANRTAVIFSISKGDKETAIAFKSGSSFVIERPLSAESVDRVLGVAYGMMIRERRRYFRCPVSVPAAVRDSDMQEFQGHTVNISEGGMAITVARSFKPHEHATVRCTLPGSRSVFEAQSIICWNSERGRVGLQFENVPEVAKADLGEWLSARLEERLSSPRESDDVPQ